MVHIGGNSSEGKSVNAYLVGVSVKSNGAWVVTGLSDGAYASAEHWHVTSSPYTEAIIVNYCCDVCRCNELCPPVTPLFHSSGNAKSVNGDSHGSFWEMILWDNFKRLVLKITESERIDAPAGALVIVAFLAAITTVVSRGILGASAQHAPE